MDEINQIGKYLKEAGRAGDLALKRYIEPSESVEKIRDVFDPEIPFQANLDIPYNMSRVMLDLNFGPRLPSIGCCGDCVCGVTESYTSDALVDGKIYLTNSYLSGSTSVYLDGLRVSQGVEYSESSAANGQLWIHIPFSTITISYQYSTGNCSETVTDCTVVEDCIDFAIFSGLATVFADKFNNRPYAQLAGGHTMGGCGQWATAYSPNFTVDNTLFPGGFSSGFIPFGGSPGHVSGKTIEGCGVIEGAPSLTISLNSMTPVATAYYSIDTVSGSTIELTLHGGVRWWQQENPAFSVPYVDIGHSTVTKTESFNVTAAFMAAKKGWRIAAYPTGEKYVRLWEWGAAESTGIEMTLALSDWDGADTIPDLIDYRMLTPTFFGATVNISSQSMIKFGAGLDIGDWENEEGYLGRSLHICHLLADVEGHPYFGDCDSEFTSQNASSGTAAGFQGMVTWPVVIGDVPPEGTGRAGEIIQSLGTCYGAYGRASGYVIRGKIRVGFAATGLPVSVIFTDFGNIVGGVDIPYSDNNFVGGSQVGSVSLTTNGDWVPFQYSITANQYDYAGRWGAHIPQVDEWAQALEFIFPAFLSAPNYWLSISITEYEVEALENVHCTANDICGLCQEHLCPEVVDTFATDNFGPYLATSPSSVTINRLDGSGTTQSVIYSDGVKFESVGAGVGRVTWHGTLVNDFGYVYMLYPSSPFSCRTSLEENIYASAEYKISSLTDVGNYIEVYWGGYSEGAQSGFWIADGVAHPEHNNVNTSWNIVPGVWMTAEYKTDGVFVLSRTYQTGTTPPAWSSAQTTADDLANSPDPFYIYAGIDQVNTPTSYNVEFKNVIVRRI